MIATPYALHNSILSQLNLSPEGMTFAQIYDRMKADRREFGLEFIRKVTAAVIELHGDNLISCDDIFAEPGNGSVREREVLYKIAHRGKMHLLGLALVNSSTGNILDIAASSGGSEVADAVGLWPTERLHTSVPTLNGSRSPEHTGVLEVGRDELPKREVLISKIADGYPSAIVKGGGETAPAISLPPSQISVVTESVERVMAEANRIAVSNREQCDCGKSVTRVCPCGKEVCSAHWYDADGNHTLSDKDGMCSECVSALQLQTWGESRNGVTQ